MAKVVLTGLLLLCLVLTSGCGGGKQQSAETRVPESEAVALHVAREPVPIEELMKGRSGIIRLVIGDGTVEPNQIEARRGHPVRLHVVNQSRRTQNFILDEMGIVGRPLAPGEENYIEFTPGRTGRFPYLGDHSGQIDWKGYLTVR